MRTVGLLVVVVIALVGLVLVTFDSAVAPDAVPKPSRSLADSRIFMLLPDGKVEISDTRARRVFKWDGQQWLQLEMSRAATPVGEMQ